MTRRILYVELGEVDDGYDVLAVFELVEDEWVEAGLDAYSGSETDDLYLSDGDDGLVWLDEDEFSTEAIGELGTPPAAEHANAVYDLFAAHIAEVYGDDEDMMPVETLAFIVTVEDESEDEDEA